MKAITIFDVAVARGMNPDNATGGEFERLGLPMIGGCQRCEATIAAYNAAPSQTGYLLCADSCIGELGFPSVKAYEAWEKYQEALQGKVCNHDKILTVDPIKPAGQLDYTMSDQLVLTVIEEEEETKDEFELGRELKRVTSFDVCLYCGSTRSWNGPDNSEWLAPEKKR